MAHGLGPRGWASAWPSLRSGFSCWPIAASSIRAVQSEPHHWVPRSPHGRGGEPAGGCGGFGQHARFGRRFQRMIAGP